MHWAELQNFVVASLLLILYYYRQQIVYVYLAEEIRLLSEWYEQVIFLNDVQRLDFFYQEWMTNKYLQLYTTMLCRWNSFKFYGDCLVIVI